MNKLLFKASELLSSPPGFYFVLAAKGACASGFDVNPVGQRPSLRPDARQQPFLDLAVGDEGAAD